MKDLDFDELDRAVNSLMTNVATSDTPTPGASEKEKTLEITPTLSGNQKPSFENLSTAAEKPAAPALSSVSTPAAPAARTPLAARRAGGRFMDVVHPSSDMKKPTAVPARQAVSRQGATIAPTAHSTPEVPSSSPQKAEETPASPPRPLAVPDRPAPSTDWPDPLDMANFTTDSKEKAEETPSVETEPATAAVSKDEQTPLTSPFLSGTKVEKRPLGGQVADEPDHTPVLGAQLDEAAVPANADDQLPASPEKPEPELPEELQDDLMVIEADTTTHKKEETPKEDEPKEVPPLKKAMPLPDVPQQEEKLLTAGPTSIPQQYREEPTTGDKENGAIYDTSTYHQPLAHPAKKKSGWLWVLWIVIILVLGAGAGAALYFFGIV